MVMTSFVVINTIGGQCEGQRRVIVTQPSGYLASVVSQDQGVGTGDCPWVIRASPGQTVTLHLRYFGQENRSPEGPVDSDSQPEACYDLLTFREPGSEYYTVSTCDALPKGEREVYRSGSHEVQVQLVGRMQLRTLGRFMIRFQGILKVTDVSKNLLRKEDSLIHSFTHSLNSISGFDSDASGIHH